MHNVRVATLLLVIVIVLSGLVFLPHASAQNFHVEAGGGWAIPSSSANLDATVFENGEVTQRTTLSSDLDSDAHVYAAAGLTWSISSNFDLGVQLRAQQSRMRGDAASLTSRIRGCSDGACRVSNDPDGRLRVASFEGQLMLTSIGWIKPYFLVGLGVAHTTVDGLEVETPDAVVRFSDESVTDAGGDVGFGALMTLVGNLALTAEIRTTGSLPGGKENAVTVFPFSLGLSYSFR